MNGLFGNYQMPTQYSVPRQNPFNYANIAIPQIQQTGRSPRDALIELLGAGSRPTQEQIAQGQNNEKFLNLLFNR